MTNMQASTGVAQLEKLDGFVEKKGESQKRGLIRLLGNLKEDDIKHILTIIKKLKRR